MGNWKGITRSLIELLSKTLKVSIIELMQGEYITNQNKSSNMLKSNFSVCPICGNIIYTMEENINSCCGINLPILETELENEYFISLEREITKEHYISFIAYITNDRCEIVKLYPEQSVEARFLKRGKGIIYVYCNKDGLIKKYLKLIKKLKELFLQPFFI